MIYIYDILLNFGDCDKMYEFFEWNENDTIEHVKRIPLMKVSTEVFHDFYYGKVQVPEKFLENIFELTEVFHENRIRSLEYACLITDGRKAMAVEFDSKGIEICKSQLLLDEEEEVLEIVERLEQESISYTVLESFVPCSFVTRKEEAIRHYLLQDLHSAYEKKDYSKIKYLYTEYFDTVEDNVKQCYHKLVEGLKNNMDEQYQKLYYLLKLSNAKK